MFEQREDYIDFLRSNCHKCSIGWCNIFYNIVRGMHFMPDVFPEDKIKDGKCLELKIKKPRLGRPPSEREFGGDGEIAECT